MLDVACCRRPTTRGPRLVGALRFAILFSLIVTATLPAHCSLIAGHPDSPGAGTVPLANPHSTNQAGSDQTVTNKPVSAQPISDQPVSDQPVSDQPESILVRRDLSVRTPVVAQAIGPDGVLLDDGTHVPWFDILVGQNWQLASPTEPQPLADREIQEWQQVFGQPWFLIRSRLARGESFQVDELLEGLAQSYSARGTPSVGAVAVSYYRSQQLAQAADPTAAALEWLRAQIAWSQLPPATTPPQSPDWETRLQQYVNPSDFPLDPILRIPLHAPPAFERWTDAEKSQWHALWEQIQTPPASRRPADTAPGFPAMPSLPAPSATVAASDAGVAGAVGAVPATGAPAQQHAKTLVAVYGLAAATQHADSATLEKCLTALSEQPTAAQAQPTLVQGLAEVARRVRRCQQDPAHWQTTDGLRDYRSLEQEWLGNLPTGEGPTGEGPTGDGPSGDGATGDGATGDGATRQRLVWEVYLQGLVLLTHEDRSAQDSGRLHVWLLRHWAERYPELAAEVPLLQPSVWRPLLTR